MQFQKFSFGSIRIDGVDHEHDVVIDRGKVRKRKKKPSKQIRMREEVAMYWSLQGAVAIARWGALPLEKTVNRLTLNYVVGRFE